MTHQDQVTHHITHEDQVQQSQDNGFFLLLPLVTVFFPP